jgi:hypothetical protein
MTGQPYLISLRPFDLALVIDALAKAASRHETQARAVKFGRKHDDTAAAMRALRRRLVRDRAEQ